MAVPEKIYFINLSNEHGTPVSPNDMQQNSNRPMPDPTQNVVLRLSMGLIGICI